MLWKKQSLRNARLYLILDTQVNNYSQLFEILEKAIQSEVDIVQLRDKNGRDEAILDFSKKALKLINGRIPYIINDRLDLALTAQAAGVHIGQDDSSIKEARKVLGEEAVIGVSCQTWEQAVQAEKEGADYIGFGSVFKTLTKPDREPMQLELLGKIVHNIQIPVFPIGGINLKNISKVVDVGARRAAVCREICQSEEVEIVVKKFKSFLDN